MSKVDTLFKMVAVTVTLVAAVVPCRAQYDCSGAIPVELDQTYTGDTAGQLNMFGAYCYADLAFDGGEIIYELSIPENDPREFQVTLTPLSGDLQLMVLDECEPDIGCISFGALDFVTEVPMSGKFYLVIDSTTVAGEGAFELDLIDLSGPIAAYPAGWSGIKAVYR